MTCSYCFQQAGKGILGGKALTPYTCEVCKKKYTHSSTDVPKLCQSCGSKNKACRYCRGKLF